MNPSHAVRYIAAVIYRKNDISLQRYIARTIYRRDIEEKRPYLFELSLQRIAYMCDILPRYHRYIARTKSDIQRLSFALLLHNTVAFPRFNDLGRTVTPTFLSRNRFYLQLSLHCPKMNKKSMWEVQKNSRFLSTRHRILPYCGCMKLWSLNANLFFKEPHQLIKFA